MDPEEDRTGSGPGRRREKRKVRRGGGGGGSRASSHSTIWHGTASEIISAFPFPSITSPLSSPSLSLSSPQSPSAALPKLSNANSAASAERWCVTICCRHTLTSLPFTSHWPCSPARIDGQLTSWTFAPENFLSAFSFGALGVEWWCEVLLLLWWCSDEWGEEAWW